MVNSISKHGKTNRYSDNTILEKIRACDENYVGKEGWRIKNEIDTKGFSRSALSDYQAITDAISLLGKERLERDSKINIQRLCEVARCYKKQFEKRNIVEYKGSFFTKISLFFSKLVQEGFRSALFATYLRVEEINNFPKDLEIGQQDNKSKNERYQELLKENDKIIETSQRELDDILSRRNSDDIVSQRELDDIVSQRKLDDIVSQRELDDFVLKVKSTKCMVFLRKDKDKDKDKDKLSMELRGLNNTYVHQITKRHWIQGHNIKKEKTITTLIIEKLVEKSFELYNKLRNEVNNSESDNSIEINQQTLISEAKHSLQKRIDSWQKSGYIIKINKDELDRIVSKKCLKKDISIVIQEPDGRYVFCTYFSFQSPYFLRSLCSYRYTTFSDKDILSRNLSWYQNLDNQFKSVKLKQGKEEVEKLIEESKKI